MTEELLENEIVDEKPIEFDFLKKITLLNSAGAKKEYNAPEVVPGRLYRKANSMKYKLRKLQFENDGKGKYKKDEKGNYIPVEMTEEIELAIIDLHEEFLVDYFKNQFTVEELQDGLDARVYQETLEHAWYSALGNRTVLVEEKK